MPTLLIFIHIEHIFCMPIFSRIFLSNYWWQKSDIWSQALYRYPISWEAFFDPSDSYFLFAKQQEYHKWALAHSSSCLSSGISIHLYNVDFGEIKIKYEQNLSKGDWTSLNSCWGGCLGWQPILMNKIDRFWLWYIIGLSSCLMITQVWFDHISF